MEYTNQGKFRNKLFIIYEYIAQKNNSFKKMSVQEARTLNCMASSMQTILTEINYTRTATFKYSITVKLVKKQTITIEQPFSIVHKTTDRQRITEKHSDRLTEERQFCK